MTDFQQSSSTEQVCVSVCVAGWMLNTHSVCSIDHVGKGSVKAGAHSRPFTFVDSFQTKLLQKNLCSFSCVTMTSLKQQFVCEEQVHRDHKNPLGFMICTFNPMCRQKMCRCWVELSVSSRLLLTFIFQFKKFFFTCSINDLPCKLSFLKNTF